ncbi:MAG: LysR family transcriptional regulator [Gammaproteobacteria bacterium]|jgi:DNA-binding transcriptional LysR family regulator|nr:LysR family transcriptional regulator [Gammaproteobacteria bacterium]
MRLRHVEVFNNVYKTGSVTAAAKLLNVSQPSVSKVLAHAEQQIGFPLFERIKRRLIATPEADILYRHTAVMEDVLTDINEISVSLADIPVDRLRVACTPSLGIDFLPKAIAKFKLENPNVNFEISSNHYQEIRKNISDTLLDLAIAQDQTEDEEIGIINLAKGKFVILEPKNNQEENYQSLPFIKLSFKSPLGKKIDQYILKNKLHLESTITSDNYQMAASLVNNGFGYTILDEYTAKTSRLPNSQITELSPKLEFNINLMFLKNVAFSIPTKKFIEFLSDFHYKL